MKRIPLPVLFLAYCAAMYAVVAYVIPFGLPTVIPFLPKFLQAVWGGDVPGAIIPASVLWMYMAMVLVAGIVYLSADEGRWARFKDPILELLTPGPGESRAKRWGRSSLLAFVPLAGALGVFSRLEQKAVPPAEIRKVHPAPPDAITVRGRELKLQGLENPYRDYKDPAKLARHTEEGKRVYYRNCFFCHGDAMDGKGPFAQGVNPPPADFVDPGTIAMLTESFVFWRVAYGGPGMPEDANTSWNSAMPVWQDMLSDEEMWKVILWIYQGTGRRPRTWSDEHGEH